MGDIAARPSFTHVTHERTPTLMTARRPARAGQKPNVINDVFHYTTKAGVKIAIDLDIPPSVLVAAGDDATEEQQFAEVAKYFGEAVQAAYDQMGMLERARFLSTFFMSFEEAAGIPLGESFSSSDSSRSTDQL